MDLLLGHARVALVENLKRNRGRLTFHYEPDFCGRMNVVLDEPAADRVTFSCSVVLSEGEVCTLADGHSQRIRVRITEGTDHRYMATVVED